MIIKVRVKPASGKQDIKKVNEYEYKISLKSRPEDNKANIELIKLLKRHFKKENSLENIKILKGLKSRDKIIEAD